jgi:serine dehydratase beta subunit
LNMSKEEKEFSDIEQPGGGEHEDPFSTSELISQVIPPGVDRRTFMMRSAVVVSAAIITGRPMSAQEKTQRSTGTPPKLDPSLNVVKKAKGPVMTTLEEFYKVGPGPSSSHTIGPMRIIYTGASAPPARATAPNAHRSPGWSGRSPQPSIPPFSTA